MKTAKIERSSWSSLLLFSFAVMATIFFFYPFIRIGVDPHHDGIMLKPALDVANGQVLFRDTFTQYGALTTYIQALFLKLFGPTLLSLRWSALGIYAATAGVLAVCWRAFLPPVLVLISIIYWLAMPNFYQPDIYFLSWSSVYAAFFQSLAYLFLIQSIRSKESRKSAFFSGVFAACTFLCRFPVGFFLFLALLTSYALFVLLDWKNDLKLFLRSLFACAFGFTSVLAGFILELIYTHSFNEWVYQNFSWPAYWAQSNSSNLISNLQSCFLGNSSRGLAFLAILLLFTLTIHVLKRISKTTVYYRRGIVLFGLGLTGMLLWSPTKRFIYSSLDSGYPSGIMFSILGFFLMEMWTIFKDSQKANGVRIRKNQLILIGSSLLAFASWLQYYPVPCGRHQFWALTPVLGIFIYSYYDKVFKNKKFTSFVLAFLIVPVATIKLQQAGQSLRLSESMRPASGFPALKGILMEPHLAEDLSTLAGAVREYSSSHLERPILIESPDALYGTLTSRTENPGPLYVRWSFNRDIVSDRKKFIRYARPLIITQTGPSAFLPANLNQLLHPGMSDYVQELLQNGKYEEILHLSRISVKVLAPKDSP
jgi:hypothetical protein